MCRTICSIFQMNKRPRLIAKNKFVFNYINLEIKWQDEHFSFWHLNFFLNLLLTVLQTMTSKCLGMYAYDKS